MRQGGHPRIGEKAATRPGPKEPDREAQLCTCTALSVGAGTAHERYTCRNITFALAGGSAKP